SSIIPSEHSKATQGLCKRCHSQPLLEKVSHGLYRGLPQPRAVPSLSIHDKLFEALKPFAGETLKVETLRSRVGEGFADTHLPSGIPSDHTAGGACRFCADQPLLARTRRRGWY